jgi:deoxyribodipyrimidine photo-lyase
MQKLESEPEIEFHAFNRACDDLRPRAGYEERLERWQSGQTGYPFIDACMRALCHEGWINFRMRAMLLSFAAYHLWIDWRDFKDWLACQFIDYEPGIHLSQCQMQSGVTGINTLRIYNPIKQGMDHDADGAFIRQWIPELRNVAKHWIHEPWRMPRSEQIAAGCCIGKEYSEPIVDHGEAVKQARAQFSRLRQSDDYWNEARRVMEQHGSRKSTERRPTRSRQADRDRGQTELAFHD